MQRVTSWSIVVISAGLVVACSDSVVVNTTPTDRPGDVIGGDLGPCGSEDTDGLCDDGVDNDCDGLTDCDDRDCDDVSCDSNGFVCRQGSCQCGGGGEEFGSLACGNGLDDDCDGLTDCSDGNCTSVVGCSCTPTSTVETDCTDGRDNDCDGFPDCEDTECVDEVCRPAAGECDVAETCNGSGVCPPDGFVSNGTECGSRSCAGSGSSLRWREQVCQDGQCTGTNLLENCDDTNPCTDDSCDAMTGCGHANNTNDCGSTFCSGLSFRQEVCSAGTCSDWRVLESCNDSNVCTNDTCDDTAGCANANNTADCGSTYCSGLSWRQERCSGGTCSDWRQIESCNDSNVCTNDSCNDGTGCGHTNNTSDCGGTFCSSLSWRQQRCSGGSCSSWRELDNCADGNVCTDDACSGSTGCSNTNNTDDCGGPYCTGLQRRQGVCSSGSCSSFRVLANCGGSDPCTVYDCTSSGCEANPKCVWPDWCDAGSCRPECTSQTLDLLSGAGTDVGNTVTCTGTSCVVRVYLDCPAPATSNTLYESYSYDTTNSCWYWQLAADWDEDLYCTGTDGNVVCDVQHGPPLPSPGGSKLIRIYREGSTTKTNPSELWYGSEPPAGDPACQ